MNKTETVQLFSKLIQQNKEILEELTVIKKGQEKIRNNQKVLSEGQGKLLANQRTIWDFLKKIS